MSADKIYEYVLQWSKKYSNNFYDIVVNNKDYLIKIFNIERENTKKPRKDISKWNEVEKEVEYFFKLDEKEVEEKLKRFDLEDVKKIKELFVTSYNIDDDNQQWFEKVKQIAKSCGYCENMKEYKENPNNYKGSIADVATILRILITGREQSPDLCEIMKVLGIDEVKNRLK